MLATGQNLSNAKQNKTLLLTAKKHNFCLFCVGVFVLGELSKNCHYLNLGTASASIDEMWIFLDKKKSVSILKCLASLFLLLCF